MSTNVVPQQTPYFDFELSTSDDLLALRVSEQAALFDLTDKLYRAEALPAVYEAAVDAIMRALRCHRASILLFDETAKMRFVAQRGLSDTYRRAVEGHSPWDRDTCEPEPILIPNVGASDMPPALRSVVAAEGIGALAFIPVIAKGKVAGKFMTYFDQPHRFSEGEILLALTIARQLGFAVEREQADEARRQSEAGQQLLLREMSHRVKNILAIVSGVVALSSRYSKDPKDLPKTIRERINALTVAHDLILPGEGRENSGLSLRSLVSTVLSPYDAQELGSQRVSLVGKDIKIGSAVATTLALIFHELATNAVKHGSLSLADGTVRVEWEIDDHLTVRWREREGPQVDGPRGPAGFGSHLLQSSVTSLGGSLEENWNPLGLELAFNIPADRIG